jgi:hypothetical protein
MKNLPARVRSYAAYEHTLDQLKRYYDSVKVRCCSLPVYWP